MTKKLFIIAFILINSSAFCQEQILYSQYLFNPLVINPAYAGNSQYISLLAFNRNQWKGIKGSPRMNTVAIHSPFKKERLGAGIMVSQERENVISKTSIQGSYSYKINFKTGKLALGISSGYRALKAAYSELKIRNDEDESFQNDVRENELSFGTGIYYFTSNYYLGVSVPEIKKLNSNPEVEIASDEGVYFVNGGVIVPIGPEVNYKPNFLIYGVNGKVYFDINSSFLFKEVIWVGVSYRYLNSINGIIQLQINDNLSFGYSYDYGMNSLSKESKGSHEITLNYFVSFSSKKVLSPRFF